MNPAGIFTIYHVKNTSPPRNKAANHAVQFINQLKLNGDYYGQQTKLRPWQENIVRRIFGTLNKDGTRQYRKVFLFLPRGAAKTTLAAQIVIYSLLGLGEKGQQIISAATSREQAARLFDYAKQSIDQDSFLRSLVEPIPSQKRLVIPTKSSFYVALSAEASSAHGYNPNILIFDELEAFSGKDVDLYQILTTSLGKRAQPLTIMIATGSTERNSLVVEELEYAKRVEADPDADPTYLPILFYAKDGERWDDLDVWKRVHPAAGDFFSLDYLRNECEQAKLVPSRQAVFEAYYLNRFTQSQKTWIPDSAWMKNSTTPLHDPSTVYCGGLDLASVKDTNSLVLYGRRPDGKFDIIPWFWIAGSQTDQRTSADQNFKTWVRNGLIRATPGETADQEMIFKDILEIFAQFNIKSVAIDPHGARQWLAPALEREGLPITYIPQTVRYISEPLKRLERQALNGELCHGGNPVLRWQLGCSWVVPDANQNYFLNKSKSRDTVDGIAALANAIGAYMYDEMQEDAGPSTYETEGLFFV